MRGTLLESCSPAERTSRAWTRGRWVKRKHLWNPTNPVSYAAARVIDMTASAPLSLPSRYLRWQQQLAHEFFADKQGQPVVMFVDADELRRLVAPGEDAVWSLADAVRTMVNTRLGSTMFEAVLRQQELWRRSAQEEPPPTLPVLALSVLAASQMHGDSAGAAHNYYVRLAAAFLPDAPSAEVESLRHTLRERGAFVDVADMWQCLHQWLCRRSGAFGISTIPENPALSRIGYPLSQALVRRTDRSVLTRFFDRLHLDTTGPPPPAALMHSLRVWTRNRSQGFSDRFMTALNDPQLQIDLEPLIHALAASWDGKVVDAEGLRRLELRLTIDIDRGLAWWVIPAVHPSFTDTLVGTMRDSAFTVTVSPDAYSSMFRAAGLPPVTSDMISNGVSARGQLSVLEFRPTQLVILSDNADAGGWTSVDALTPFEDHLIVAAPEIRNDVERALDIAADKGWRRLRDKSANRIIPNYSIYHSVTFSSSESLEEASKYLPASISRRIRLGTTARPRFVNGLPIHTNLGRNIYLAGGEPDLELPVAVEPRRVKVTLDGDRTQEFQASVFPIPLSRFGPYTEGDHTLSADGETIKFHVVNPSAPAHHLLSDDLAWSSGTLAPNAHPRQVCGAWTGDIDSTPLVLARRGAREEWIIDHRGHTTRIYEPEPPNFLPEIAFMYFEVKKDLGAWLLQERATGWTLTRLTPTQPAFQTLNPEDRDVWRRAERMVKTSDGLWSFYLREWERVK